MSAAIVLESFFYLVVILAAPLLYPIYLHRVKGFEKRVAYQHSRLFAGLITGVLLLGALALWVRPVSASPAVAHLAIDKKKADAEAYMKSHGYVFAAGLANETWHAVYSQRKGLPQLFLIDR